MTRYEFNLDKSVFRSRILSNWLLRSITIGNFRLTSSRLLFYSLLTYSLLTNSQLAYSQTFNNFFLDRTLRVDCYHTGTKGTETFSLDQVLEEGPWAGSVVNLLDTLNLGEYQMRVYDEPTAALIYSRGY